MSTKFAGANAQNGTATGIGISEGNAKETATLLNELLADEFVLYTKTRNYHWNVEGMEFGQLHKFFEDQYGQLEEIVDEAAERTRMLGHYALGSLTQFSKLTRLTEGQDASNAQKMLQNLLDDHATIIRVLREQIPVVSDKYKDLGNADFMTRILEEHEKMSWMIRAHLKG